MTRLLAVLLTWVLAGCAVAPPADRPELEELRADYAAISAVPEIARHAPVPLYEAEQAIVQAANAPEAEEYDHQVYLARRYLDLAQAVTRQALAQLEVQRLSGQRDQLRLAERQREAARIEASTERLQAELAALETQQTERGIRITLDDILFDPGRANLSDSATFTFDTLALYLRQHPERRVVVEGHTDDTGSETFNFELSQRRAEEVKEALVERGVNADHVSAHGYGETQPVASNATNAGRQLNRRVEVIILRDGVEPPPEG